MRDVRSAYSTLAALAALFVLSGCPTAPIPSNDADEKKSDTWVKAELDTSTANDSTAADSTATDTTSTADTNRGGEDTTNPTGDTAPDPDTSKPPPDTSKMDTATDTGGGQTCNIRKKSQLLSALKNAKSGDTVCIATDAKIDMTGETDVAIPGGVTLKSDREKTGNGGLIYTTKYKTMPLFLIKQDGVRVTGLRLRGPDPKRRSGAYVKPNSRGISVHGAKNVEFDHNEFFAWSHAAIYLRNTSKIDVHHNDFHHNQRSGLGYGVVLYKGATATIKNNLFDYNRHAIAGSGDPGQGYTAEGNIALGHANGHIFDMHGENENTGNGSPYAGDEIRIRHNALTATGVYSVVIRGRPKVGAWIRDNCFGRGSQSSAILQRFHTGNLHISSNSYGVSDPDCASKRGWYVSPGGAGFRKHYVTSSTKLSDLLLGDFDGDGRADALWIKSGGAWRLSSGGNSSWKTVNNGKVSLNELLVGDFDGDGKDDVFRASGSTWFISKGATSSWQTLNASSTTADKLAAGDFNGDGKDDIFYGNGSEWKVSYGGSNSWKKLGTSGQTVSGIALGDFNGDGKTDVFRATGSKWNVSWGGTTGWKTLNGSSYGLGSLAFADLNGDGENDVIRPTGSSIEVSWSGQSSWDRRATLPYRPSDVAFADFTGDGTDDAFHTTAP